MNDEVYPLTLFAIVIGAALCAMFLWYGAERHDDGVQRGYIAGYAESRAGMPNRYECKTCLTEEKKNDSTKGN